MASSSCSCGGRPGRVAPLVFLTVCPLAIALTRSLAARAVAEGGYAFYRAAF